MKSAALMLALCAACGAASGDTCDGGCVEVTIRYMTFQRPDAGPVVGGTDAGTTFGGDAGICDTAASPCRCSFCEVRVTMPLERYRYSVQPHACRMQYETGPASFLIDCAETATCGHATPPTGASNSTCTWVPPP